MLGTEASLSSVLLISARNSLVDETARRASISSCSRAALATTTKDLAMSSKGDQSLERGCG